MKAEQLEFHFEDGELHAPISALFKRFVYETLKESVRYKDEMFYDFYITSLKRSLLRHSLFDKTPKQFQEEVLGLLEFTLPEMYEFFYDKPFEINVDTKPKLTLVK